MKIYTIIAGVNGAEKSSLTGVLRTENTNLGKIIDVDKIIAKYIRLYYVGLNTVEESLLRIENRVKKGGHDIPGFGCETSLRKKV